MLRRDSTPSPTLGDDTGASPSGVLDLWDPASWNQRLSSDPLGGGGGKKNALGADEEGEEGLEAFNTADMLGEGPELGGELLPGSALEGGEGDDKESMALQMGWPQSCLAAVELSMPGAAREVSEGGEDGESKPHETDGTTSDEIDDELPAMLPSFAKQASVAPSEGEQLSTPLDPFNLDLPSLSALPSIEDLHLQQTRVPKHSSSKSDALDAAPQSPLTEDAPGTDEPLNLIDSRTLSPSDADASDPTGGIVDGPLDDEDYCGWLAEDI